MLEEFALPVHPTLTHPLTGEPLQSVGIVGGRVIWPIMGAAEEEDDKDADGSDDGVDQDAQDKDADKLGDAGKQALDRMKAKWQSERDKARDLESKLAAASAKPVDKEDADLATARQQAMDQAIQQAAAKANERILRSEVRAAATGKLANPALALKLLDLSEFEVDADGNVDAEEISTAIAELITKEPYLAAQGRKFQGDADAGPRNGAKGQQISAEQVKTMTPEQIVEAQTKGLLDDYLAS